MSRKKWYVTYRGVVINEAVYASTKLGEALALARLYKALREDATGRVCVGVYVAKMDGERGEPLHQVADGTQRHYI